MTLELLNSRQSGALPVRSVAADILVCEEPDEEEEDEDDGKDKDDEDEDEDEENDGYSD
jgi:hypothetical protein